LSAERRSVLIILGPTGVGKSALAVELALRFGGEVINGDSMQVYRGFDIGTAKPSMEERRKVPHHLLDILGPEEQFSAADFVRLAAEAITAILSRGRLPIVAGGTGLYLKALLDGLFPGPGRDSEVRRRLREKAEAEGLESLYRRLEETDPAYARKVGPHDRVRIIRALEVFYLTQVPLSAHFNRTEPSLKDVQIIKIGLKLDRKELVKRIEDRVDRMLEQGFVEEVRSLLARNVSPDAPPFQALGYRHVQRYLNNETSLEQAVALTKQDTRQYAKRQMTWFRKMTGIVWFEAGEDRAAAGYVGDHL
jgi:tRNA dimethylallyltransferase